MTHDMFLWRAPLRRRAISATGVSWAGVGYCYPWFCSSHHGQLEHMKDQFRQHTYFQNIPYSHQFLHLSMDCNVNFMTFLRFV